MLVADYTFLDFFWSMLLVFVWILWFWILFTIWIDVFRRDDLSGLGKTAWLIFTLVLPFLGAFIYLIKENDGMTERMFRHQRRQQQQMDEYVRDTAGSGGGSAGEIARAKDLLDQGAITEEEFAAIKAKALA